MAIIRPEGPSDGMAVVSRAVAHLMTRGPGALDLPKGGAAPQASQPMQLFAVQMGDLVSGRFVDRATLVGWLYLIYGPGPIAVAEVRSSPSGVPTFGRLIRGVIADRLEEAANLASRLYEDTKSRFEARVLEIPELYVTALWLHGARDIFIPLLEGGARDVGSVREDESFTQRMIKAASQRIQHRRT